MSHELKILMLEDVPEEAELLQRELHRAGLRFTATRVQTREGFCAAVNELAPDVILADSKLPAFDGLSALRIARCHDPYLPVIMVTGELGDEAAVEFLKAGASDYVLKDRLARLAPAVRRALAEAQSSRAQQESSEKIRRLTRVLRMLSGINTAVVRISDQAHLLEEACRIAHDVGQYAFAFVALIDTGARVAHPVAWHGRGAERRGAVSFPLGESPEADAAVTARVLRTGALIAIDDVRTYRGPISSAERMDSAETHGLACLPLLVDGTPVGAFTVAAPAQQIIGSHELDLLQEVTANLSFALQYLHHEQTLHYLSYFDPLTDLANRTLFCERLARHISRAPGSHWLVAAFNVQCLSMVNDSFGRYAGDLFLQCVADRLKQVCGGSEQIAHLGGGAFAVLFSGDLTGERPHARLAEAFRSPLTVRGHDIPVPLKCGLARFPEHGPTAETLVQNAEAALHVARESGATHLYYRPHMSARSAERLALEYRLRGALERGEFVLHYQPQFHRRDRRIVGAEALLRWRDPERGLVCPGMFLPVLESSGLIVAVGEWVAAEAAAACRRWRQRHLPPIRLAVNVSTLELSQPGFAERFLRGIRASGADDAGIDIEITESGLINDAGSAIETLQYLRAHHVRVAIDDFGVAYSSLSRLADLPIDTLKIDRSFTSRLTPERRTQAIVSTIIALAHAYDLDTVAEGVETPEQLEILGALGCEHSQGYLHSSAVPPEALENLLAAPARMAECVAHERL